MTDSTYDIEFSAENVAGLEMFHMQFPKVEVSTGLQDLLAKHNVRLSLDENNLYEGLISSRLHIPISVHIGAQPLTHEGGETSREYDVDDRLELHLLTDPTPTEKEDSQYHANYSFWLGLFTINELEDPATLGEYAHFKKTKKLRKKAASLSSAACFLVAHIGAVAGELPVPLALKAGLGGTGTLVGLYSKVAKIPESLEDFVESQPELKVMAEEYARKYEVIRLEELVKD